MNKKQLLPLNIPNIELENGMYIKCNNGDVFLVLKNNDNFIFVDIKYKVINSNLIDKNIIEIRKSNLDGIFFDNGPIIFKR